MTRKHKYIIGISDDFEVNDFSIVSSPEEVYARASEIATSYFHGSVFSITDCGEE